MDIRLYVLASPLKNLAAQSQKSQEECLLYLILALEARTAKKKDERLK